MDNMYINISEDGFITDITNNKLTNNEIYLGVKYILGKDSVVFTREDDKVFVLRTKGCARVLYKYEFEEPGDYMITPLFVDKYKSNHPLLRDIYAFMKRNFKGKFYLEENNNLNKKCEVIFSSWIDVNFDYKFKVSINTNIMEEEDAYVLRDQLMVMKNINLLKLYNNLNGKSIFIDNKSIGLLKSIDSLFDQDTEKAIN